MIEKFLNSLPRPYISPILETRESQIAGVGQFALQSIKAGEIIAIEKGPVVSGAVVVAIEEIGGYSLDTCIGWNKYFLMAPLEHGGEGGIINHSCEPNVGFLDEGIYITIRPVTAGEELCCDYGTFETMNEWSMKCECGTKTCRNTITAKDYLLPDLQKRLGKWFMPYLKPELKNIT